MDFCLAGKKDEKGEEKLCECHHQASFLYCVCARVHVCACVSVFTGISLHMHRVGFCTDNSSMAVAYFQQNNMFEVKDLHRRNLFSGASSHSEEMSGKGKKKSLGKKNSPTGGVEFGFFLCIFFCVDALAFH